MTPGSAEFSAKWKEIAAADPEGLHQAEKGFLERTHYNPRAAQAEKLGFDMTNPAIRDAVWSGSIQHGQFGTVLENAAQSRDVKSMSSEDQIKALYAARTQYANQKGVAPASGSARYEKEIRDVLAVNEAYKKGNLGKNKEESKGTAAPEGTATSDNVAAEYTTDPKVRREKLLLAAQNAEAGGDTKKADALRRVAAREAADSTAQSATPATTPEPAKPSAAPAVLTPTAVATNKDARKAALEQKIKEAEAAGNTATADKFRGILASGGGTVDTAGAPMTTAQPRSKATAALATPPTAEEKDRADLKSKAEDIRTAQAKYAQYEDKPLTPSVANAAASTWKNPNDLPAGQTASSLASIPGVIGGMPTRLASAATTKLPLPASVGDIQSRMDSAMGNIKIPGLEELTGKLTRMAEGLGNFGKEKEKDNEGRDTPTIPFDFEDTMLTLWSYDRL